MVMVVMVVVVVVVLTLVWSGGMGRLVLGLLAVVPLLHLFFFFVRFMCLRQVGVGVVERSRSLV